MHWLRTPLGIDHFVGTTSASRRITVVLQSTYRPDRGVNNGHGYERINPLDVIANAERLACPLCCQCAVACHLGIASNRYSSAVNSAGAGQFFTLLLQQIIRLNVFGRFTSLPNLPRSAEQKVRTQTNKH
jgi:hypothetical protein